MKIAIVTPTYRKLDGSTHIHLSKTLESVKNQTHKDYKVFLIGDNYTNNDELLELSKIIDDDKIYVENLPVALERSKYNGEMLWHTGGVNASNIGITRALSEGYEYVCCLDDDDIFFENHLSLISECIERTNVNFIATKCGPFPNIIPIGFYTHYRPLAERLYKCTTCVNFKYFNMFFRNVFEETGKSYPSDADLWKRIKAFLENKNEWGIFINQITCDKLDGNFPVSKPDIVK